MNEYTVVTFLTSCFEHYTKASRYQMHKDRH